VCSKAFGGLVGEVQTICSPAFRTREDHLEILLITTREKRRWSVPKGWPIKRTAPHETAVIEAYEEAGVCGEIGEKHIGRFRKRRIRKNQSVLCEVQIFPLEVTHQQNDWTEKQERNRMWVAPRKAAKLVKKSALRRAIEDFRISSNFHAPLTSNRSVRMPRRPSS
jgi:8-oxo-dGTP pyrophosphatase MutT (NUDIX family)